MSDWKSLFFYWFETRGPFWTRFRNKSSSQKVRTIFQKARFPPPSLEHFRHLWLPVSYAGRDMYTPLAFEVHSALYPFLGEGFISKKELFPPVISHNSFSFFKLHGFSAVLRGFHQVEPSSAFLAILYLNTLKIFPFIYITLVYSSKITFIFK